MQKTVSVINLSAIRHNAAAVRKMVGGKLYAVVKADAYGHGAAEISREIEDLVDGFCVAICEEGALLRLSGIEKPILVFAPLLDADDAVRASYYGLTVTVAGYRSALFARGLPCHIKINTGMNRYGCSGVELSRVLTVVRREDIRGVYSHFYAAHDAAEREKQLKRFLPALKLVKHVNPSAVAHISASGGILAGKRYAFDGARCGIMLYGYTPSGFKCDGLERALKVYARRAQRTKVVEGGVGYGVADKKYAGLSTYRLGYADGFFRGVPLGEGKLCMDAFISCADEEYAEVLNDAQAYAGRCGTIPYEILCAVTRRSLKVYER